MSFKQRNKVLQYVMDSGEVHYLNKILFDNQDIWVMYSCASISYFV